MKSRSINEASDDTRFDGPYSWLVCAATSLIHFIYFGSLKSNGVYFVAFKYSYGIGNEDAAKITIFCFASMLSSAVFVSFAIRVIGYRWCTIIGSLLSSVSIFLAYLSTTAIQLILTFGILRGIGYGFIAIPSVTLISQYSKKYLASATGISVIGTSIGSMVLPPLFELVIQEYGVKGSLLILSGFNLNLLVFSLLLRDPPANQNSSIDDIKKDATRSDKLIGAANPASDAETDNLLRKKLHKFQRFFYNSSLWYIIKEKKIAILGIGISFLTLQSAITGFYISILDFGVKNDYEILESTYFISVNSAFDIVSRLLYGIFLDKIKKYQSFAFFCALLLQSIDFALLGLIGHLSYSYAMVISGFIGFFFGCILIHVPVSCVMYIGREKMSTSMCINSLFAVIPLFCLPPVMTFMLEIYGSYSEFYMIISVMFFISAVYWLVFSILDFFKNRKQTKNSHISLELM